MDFQATSTVCLETQEMEELQKEMVVLSVTIEFKQRFYIKGYTNRKVYLVLVIIAIILSCRLS